MFTLKIRWVRYEDGDLKDESTLFIPADTVTVHGEITSMEQMSSWEPGSYFDYTVASDSAKWSSRLIAVAHNEKLTWYLASHAWLLGVNGQTIERLA